MWTRSLLKENAKIAFKRNYWTCVAVALIMALVGGGVEGSLPAFSGGQNESEGIDGVEFWRQFHGKYIMLAAGIVIIFLVVLMFSIAFKTFVVNAIMVGGRRYFMENREHKTLIAQAFYGFQGGHYLNCVKTMFFKDLYLFGWTLLFIIPGIIKSYSYQLVPYILAENPTLSKDRAIELSCEMMDGYKFESFLLKLSFLGWDILSAFTVGILGLFYVNPYQHATFTEFYTAVKADAFSRGITNEIELPGVSNKVFEQEVLDEKVLSDDIFAED